MGGARSLFGQLGVGDLFPPLTGIAVEGTLPAMEKQVVVVDFWASWCAPCKASFPALSRLQAEYDPSRVVVLGVSVDQKVNDYAEFLAKMRPAFSVVRDRAQQLVSLVQVPAMPTTYVIGRDGRIRAIITGYHGNATDSLLRSIVDQVLAEHLSV
ncbi:MAG: TlpA disulfide reductase family protein [Lacunisphaera sp.]